MLSSCTCQASAQQLVVNRVSATPSRTYCSTEADTPLRCADLTAGLQHIQAC